MGMNVTRHDANLASTFKGRVRPIPSDPLAGGNDSWAVGANENDSRMITIQNLSRSHHVRDRNAFGDRTYHFNTSGGGFQDAVSSKWWGDKKHGGCGSRAFYCIRNGVIDWKAVGIFLTSLAGSHASDHLGPVVKTPFGVKGPSRTGDTLAENFRRAVNEDCHKGNHDTPPAIPSAATLIRMAKKAAETNPEGLQGHEPVVVLKGTERLLQQLAIQTLENALLEQHGPEGVAVERHRGDRTPLADVLDAIRTPSLLAPHTMVIIEGTEDLIKEKDDAEDQSVASQGKKARTPRQILEEALDSPFPNATLILQADDWRPGRLDRVISERGGAIVNCKPPDEGEIPNWIDRLARDHNRRIATDAKQLLMMRVGPDLTQLDSELRKLASAAEEHIEATLVDQLVAKSTSDEVWALQEAVLSGNPEHTSRVLHEVLDIGRKSTVPAFWCLIDLARKLATLSINAERGVDPWSLSRPPKLWGPAQGPTLNVGARIDPSVAARLHREALDAQLAPRQGLGDERRALETLAIRLTLACAG